MRTQGNFKSARFLQTLWAPFATAAPNLDAPVIAGPYNSDIHSTLNYALNSSKCPDQSSSCIWNGQYLALPHSPKKPKTLILEHHDEAATTTPAQEGPKEESPKNEPRQHQQLHCIHNYFGCLLSGYDIHSTNMSTPDIASRSTSKVTRGTKAESGKATGSFLLKQERDLLGEWKGQNPYLKVDFRITFESRGGYFLHLGYHCNFYQQLVEAGCPIEVAQQVLQPRPSPFVLREYFGGLQQHSDEQPATPSPNGASFVEELQEFAATH